jgi:hypothetical protein
VTTVFEFTVAVVQTGVVAELKATASPLLAVAETLKVLVVPRVLFVI